MELNSISNDMLCKIYPETFHTRTGRKNGVGEAWGVGDSWICNCSDCAQIRREIWNRVESSLLFN
tara:strand:+ start:359 stop:553 length:195 start_codon:yes stop_codon:yes gene_type:complete